MEAIIISDQGLAMRPKLGAEIRFPAPREVTHGTDQHPIPVVELVVLVDGVEIRWAFFFGEDRMTRAIVLLSFAQTRYLEDGATLDAVALLREMG